MNDQPARPEKLMLLTETVEAIATYLAGQPYIEVFKLIKALQAAEPVAADEVQAK